MWSIAFGGIESDLCEFEAEMGGVGTDFGELRFGEFRAIYAGWRWKWAGLGDILENYVWGNFE
jgi:hypothetical protein